MKTEQNLAKKEAIARLVMNAVGKETKQQKQEQILSKYKQQKEELAQLKQEILNEELASQQNLVDLKKRKSQLEQTINKTYKELFVAPSNIYYDIFDLYYYKTENENGIPQIHFASKKFNEFKDCTTGEEIDADNVLHKFVFDMNEKNGFYLYGDKVEYCGRKIYFIYCESISKVIAVTRKTNNNTYSHIHLGHHVITVTPKSSIFNSWAKGCAYECCKDYKNIKSYDYRLSGVKRGFGRVIVGIKEDGIRYGPFSPAISKICYDYAGKYEEVIDPKLCIALDDLKKSEKTINEKLILPVCKKIDKIVEKENKDKQKKDAEKRKKEQQLSKQISELGPKVL